jgi:hypothetical protein
MKTLWGCTLGLGIWACAWAADNVPQKVHPPYFLRAKDKIPNESLISPAVSVKNAKGKIIEVKQNITPPDPGIMDLLSDPLLFEEILRTKADETTAQRFYWHSAGDFDYCHYKDLEGNNWYGWSDDLGFNWILSKGHRYWWRDPFAGNWLYYFQGYWWRSDGQTRKKIQVCINGEYYLSDHNGHILKDMGPDGNGLIVSAPGQYQGDFQRGAGEGRAGGESEKGDAGNGSAPPQTNGTSIPGSAK